ncbi:MAG: hypothetical protein NW224_06125 [Leptolyngbyaceae cyanobacterium bins.302]|nr:hypothetical protein [Leptolyngbyaceae cyanobacterium bins.302]
MAYNRAKNRNSIVTPFDERVILSLCDYSGVWSRPYQDAGYKVAQVDIKLGQDLRLLRHPGRVWGILAAPPCTVFSLAGNRTKRTDQEWLEALSVVDACLRLVWVASPRWWVLENPRGKLVHYLGSPRFEFEPFLYGDPWTKRTCLWGNFVIPEFKPVEPEFSLHQSVRDPQLRAQTPSGFATAFFKANP